MPDPIESLAPVEGMETTSEVPYAPGFLRNHKAVSAELDCLAALLAAEKERAGALLADALQWKAMYLAAAKRYEQAEAALAAHSGRARPTEGLAMNDIGKSERRSGSAARVEVRWSVDMTSGTTEMETTAEERAAVPTWRAINGDSPFMTRLLRDFDRLTALLAASEAAGKTLLGWREHDYPAHFDRWTAQYLADRYRAALTQGATP